MLEVATGKSHKILFLNTLAFTVCFAAWMFNGVLVTFLVDNQVFNWGPVKIGWLFGIPVLTGSLFRLPAGMLTDKFGAWWNKWDQAGLDAVKPLNHEIVRVDDATREKWRADLKPVLDGELAKLEKEGIANARAIYDEMRRQVARFKK